MKKCYLRKLLFYINNTQKSYFFKVISRFCFHSKSRIVNFANKMHRKFRFQLNFFLQIYILPWSLTWIYLSLSFVYPFSYTICYYRWHNAFRFIANFSSLSEAKRTKFNHLIEDLDQIFCIFYNVSTKTFALRIQLMGKL